MTKREIIGRLASIVHGLTRMDVVAPDHLKNSNAVHCLTMLAGELAGAGPGVAEAMERGKEVLGREDADECDPPAAPRLLIGVGPGGKWGAHDERTNGGISRATAGELAAWLEEWAEAERDAIRAELSAATKGRAVADPQPDYARIAMALDRAIPLLYQDGLSLYEGVREARRMLGTLQDEIVHRHCIDRSDEPHPTDFADLIASVREHEPDPGARLVPNPGQEATVLDDLRGLVREQRLVAQDQYELASKRCADLESRVAELERHVQSMRRDAARPGPTPANGAYPA